MTLPVFWLAPLAQRFDDTFSALSGATTGVLLGCAGGVLLGDCVLPTAPVAGVSWTTTTSAFFWAMLAGGKSSPKQIEDLPPGAKCKRVDGRSEITLPVFWFEPFAK